MVARARMLGSALFVAAIACASTLQERRDYILAHPHGWVEVSLDDRGVPQVPASEEEPDAWVRPESCSVEVLLDREPFVYGSAYPLGDAAPYTAETGFRFPAPVGPALLSVQYRGCDVVDGKASVSSAELFIGVEEGRVIEVHFDGAALAADPPRDNTVVTLDDIYQAVTGGKKGAP
jgi:hypothetical protein